MDNIHPSGALPPLQAQVIAALAAGASISAAALSAHISRTTLYSWQKCPSFSRALSAAKAEYIDSLHDEIRDMTQKALQTVSRLMDHPAASPSVQLKAALAVLTRPHQDANPWHLPENIGHPRDEAPTGEIAGLIPSAQLATLPFIDSLGAAELNKTEHRNTDSVQSAPEAPATPRNAACPCGSKLKFKRCCGRNAPPVLGKAA